jgi:glycosyltransferase involved in cell wall biosynthesis
MEDRRVDFEREALISREYEIVVFDDGSTEATAETLQPYGDVLPLSVLGGDRHVGYGGALTMSREQRFDIRARPNRVRPFADALNASRFAWATRGRRITPPSTGAT